MRGLRERGHAVTLRPHRDGRARSSRSTSRPDLVVLDLGLPDVDGTPVLSMLRAVSQVPVIVTTARDDDPTLVGALDAGADDYVVKPFTAPQLDARIRRCCAGSRRAGRRAATITVGGLASTRAAASAHPRRQPSSTSPRKEFDLLAHLAERPGEVVTKRELLAEVWRQPWGGSDKTVDVHLSWLRRKLGETAAEPRAT